MKRWIISVIALALSVLMLASCSKQDPNAPEGYKTASNEHVDYALFVPQDWVIDTEEKSLVVAAHVSEMEGTNISMIEFENDKYSAETTEEGEEISPVSLYWKDNLDSLTKLFDIEEDQTTFELVTDGEQSTMGKTADGKTVPAFTYLYTGKVSGVELKYKQVIAHYKGSFYFFTYTAAVDRYDEFIDEVDLILDYIVFD